MRWSRRIRDAHTPSHTGMHIYGLLYHVVIVQRTCHEYALWRCLWAVRLHIAVTVKKVLTVSRLHSDVNPTPQRTVCGVRHVAADSTLIRDPETHLMDIYHLHSQGFRDPYVVNSCCVVAPRRDLKLSTPHEATANMQQSVSRILYTLLSYSSQCIQARFDPASTLPAVWIRTSVHTIRLAFSTRCDRTFDALLALSHTSPCHPHQKPSAVVAAASSGLSSHTDARCAQPEIPDAATHARICSKALAPAERSS